MTETARKISKKQLIALRGAKCEICGITEWCNKLITFDDHHCDRNRKNGHESNRKVICPNCHRQQHLDKTGRTNRKQSIGQTGRKFPQELREKISNTMKMYGSSKGKNNGFFGKHHSEETKQVLKLKISKTMIERGSTKGEKNGMYGKEPWNKGKKTKKENAL